MLHGGSTQKVGLSASPSWTSILSVAGVVEALRELFSSSQFRDGIKFFAIGAALSTTKSILNYVWSNVRRLFLHKAVIRDTDPAYQAVLRYVVDAGAWSKSARDVEVSSYPRMPYDYVRDEDDGGTGGELVDLDSVELGINGDTHRKSETRVHFFPLATDSFRFSYEGTPVWCTRKREQIGDSNFQDTLELNFLTFSRQPLRRFFVEARVTFSQYNSGKVVVMNIDKYMNWSQAAARPKRYFNSIHLPGDTKEKLLADAKTFLLPSNRKWYADRGIPYRRGYLLYGRPGSGKTSTVHALASELDLKIYTVALTSKKMSNAVFQEMLASVPPKSIVLIEDIDAVFQSRVMKETSDDVADGMADRIEMPSRASALRQAQEDAAAAANTSDVTFQTLLNVIDGVGAPEGRILIMTTNHRELLDEALIRPGRIDLQIAYMYATKGQVLDLFTRWYEQLATSPTAPLGGGAGAEKSLPASSSSSDEGALDHAKLRELAARFVAQVPEGELSLAAIQGFLLLHKEDPHGAVDNVAAWLREQADAK
ncbi:uncharacterized protein PFL1_04409 [Pseudozyma flocculosa PF-1]|uniref:AAA+ ATPase domain-containing protein n=2 Tax=Pseudozyma flocculosa TaxID=84751 RepID=A0A5C3FEX1_9BASI|nr:uncharacterized protein PFL1_04409 [Pseudozyma flocculosa PF-1]EPQ28082.1 hypothetical protein PFL1_04409 [Pseudozyma flocculosa PF-1]SPO42205.1 uncharacterized protein PSFLO_07688 [Pseudozyma flocculosa]